MLDHRYINSTCLLNLLDHIPTLPQCCTSHEIPPNGSFTLHRPSNGNGTSTGNDGFMYYTFTVHTTLRPGPGPGTMKRPMGCTFISPSALPGFRSTAVYMSHNSGEQVAYIPRRFILVAKNSV